MTKPNSERTARARLVPAADLSWEQKRLYESIVGGPRAADARLFRIVDERGVLVGPFGPLLLSPRVGDALQQLGAALRYESGLDPRAREVVILTVAHATGSDFEWYAHEAVARDLGLTSEEIASLRNAEGAESPFAPEDMAVIALARQLAAAGDADDACLDAVVRHHSAVGAFEIAVLVGYYRTLAQVMKLFGTDSVPEKDVVRPAEREES